MGVQKDLITPAKKVGATLTFEQKQLYRYFKKWFQERHYIVVELNYKEKITPEGKRVYTFDWYTEKRVEDYTKLSIDLSFEAEIENVRVKLHDGKTKTVQQGDVEATFQGYVQKDTEDEWALSKETAQRRIFREIYDKLVIKGKYSQYENQLKKDMKAIMSDLKTYLKTHRYD
ncbi:hypothetical protein HOB85_05105 [Candidatus Woesearchaeota archaeon]|jgi:hypothetical protein|nr:hypothetical protein [Candidatus Woesearchaeota archaeon]